MSIISEALKKAGSDRPSDLRAAGSLAAANKRSRPGSALTSLAVLALLVLPFAMPRLLSRPQPAGPAAPASAALTVAAEALPMADLPGPSPSTGLAQIAVENAPLASTTLLPKASMAPKVQGIVWGQQGDAYAVLNNEVVRVGSVVGSMRVTKIAADGVTLSDGTNSEFVEKSF